MPPTIFFDSNEASIPYSGQPISWRISAYSVIVKDNQILLKCGLHEKLWDFPGGGVGEDEDLKQACLRETREETGAHVELADTITYMESWFYHKENRLFITQSEFFIKQNSNQRSVNPQIPRSKKLNGFL